MVHSIKMNGWRVLMERINKRLGCMWWRAGMNEWTEGSVYGWRAVGGQRKDQVCVVKNRLNELVLPCLLVSYCLSGSGGHRNSLHVVERNWSRRNLKLNSGTNEINKIKKTAVKFGVCHLKSWCNAHFPHRRQVWYVILLHWRARKHIMIYQEF